MSNDCKTDNTTRNDPLEAGWWVFDCDGCLGPKLMRLDEGETLREQLDAYGPYCTGCGSLLMEFATPKEHLTPDPDVMGRLEEKWGSEPEFAPPFDGMCSEYVSRVGAFEAHIYGEGGAYQVEVYGKSDEMLVPHTGGNHDDLDGAIEAAEDAIRTMIAETEQVLGGNDAD
jgi:hypothetical protein